MAGVKARRVRLCRVTGQVILYHPIWQATLRSSVMGSHKRLYNTLTFYVSAVQSISAALYHKPLDVSHAVTLHGLQLSTVRIHCTSTQTSTSDEKFICFQFSSVAKETSVSEIFYSTLKTMVQFLFAFKVLLKRNLNM